MTDATDAPQATDQAAFAIQRIYIKDCSFEAPNIPDIFRSEWQPNVDLELQISSNELEANTYEVVLATTVTTKSNDQVAFLVEVKQAGIFTLKGIPEDQMPMMLNIACPNILYPYAREMIASLVMRSTFPQLHLDPINFEALYLQNLQQQAANSSIQ